MDQRSNSSKAQAQQAPIVAVIDDDAALLTALRFALEVEGYEVRTYANGAEALDSEALKDAALLLIDYKLPDKLGNGLNLLHALRNRGVTAPALLVTTNPTRRCRLDALAAGVEIVEKPLMGEALSRRIGATLAPGGH